MNSMTLKELQTYILELNPYQFDQIAIQVVKYLKLNEQLKNTRPECCPCCGKTGEHLIKKGFQHGKQRYMCKACGKKFTYDINQITAHSHQPVDAWITVIEDTLAMKSLDETAGKIGVCHETAFNMRHKLLAYLETMIETAKPPDELVETDETYVTESQKGVKCKNRKPRKHGESASKRGLSNEQYCIYLPNVSTEPSLPQRILSRRSLHTFPVNLFCCVTVQPHTINSPILWNAKKSS